MGAVTEPQMMNWPAQTPSPSVTRSGKDLTVPSDLEANTGEIVAVVQHVASVAAAYSRSSGAQDTTAMRKNIRGLALLALFRWTFGGWF
jgi:hypothetical protein